MVTDNLGNKKPWRGFQATDRIKTVQARLESAKKERKDGLDRREKELQDARARGVVGFALDQLQKQLDDYDKMSEWAIAQLKAELGALQGEIDAEQNAQRLAAARLLAAQKAAALEAWLNRGGDRAGFDREWPLMEARILSEAVQKDLASNPASIEAKRKEYIGML